MVNEPMSSNATVHQAAGYPQGGGYGGPPQGGGFDQQGGAGGGGFGPAGGGGFPPGGGGMTPGGGGGEVNLTLPFVLSIATIFCGCGIFGFVPVFFAYQAYQAKNQGDMATAQAKAGLATKVGGGMLALGILLTIAVVILNVVASM